jgi:hypothetical protein
VNQPVDAEGAWSGSLSDGRQYNLFVFDDRSAWLFYTPAAGDDSTKGIVQGAATVAGGNLSVTAAKDFDVIADAVADAAIASTYVTASTISGTITYPSLAARNVSIQSASFAAVWLLNPDVTALSGTYAGASLKTVGADDVATMAVTTTGSVGATTIALSNGCLINGTLARRSRGNAFAFAGRWGGPPCATPGLAIDGYAFLLQPVNGVKRLTVWWTDAGRSNVWVLFGRQG